MKLYAADRARPGPGDALVVLAVLGAAALLFFALRPETGNFLTARIVLDGELVAEYRLETLTEPVVIEVPGAAYPVSVEVSPQGARILHSDCPGQDCVRQGQVTRPGGQLVCLPNRLIVSLAGDGPPELDAVTG